MQIFYLIKMSCLGCNLKFQNVFYFRGIYLFYMGRCEELGKLPLLFKIKYKHHYSKSI